MRTQSTRYARPVLAEQSIIRHGLIKKLERIPRQSIVYIHAPAGYGKTTLAAEWLSVSKMSAAWLTIDEYSTSPAEIYKGILNTLSCQAVTDDSYVHISLEHTLNTLAAHNKWPQVLVIDDFHLCSDTGVLKALPLIRARIPKDMVFMIISRNPPHDLLSDQVIKGTVRTITDLQFSDFEITELFEKNNLSISAQYAQLLKQQTDGWAAALSAILMAKNYKPYHDLLDQNTLNQYLKSSIFEVYDDFDVLKKCSVCDVLYPSLCEAIVGHENAWNVIETLANKTGFVTRHSENACRFHTLLREFLQAEMENDNHINKSELYINAANWFKKNGDRFRALHMAAKAGDIPYMEELAHDTRGEYGNDHMDMDAYIRYVEEHLLPIPNHISSQYPLISIQCFHGALNSRPIDEVIYWLDVLEDHIKERRYIAADYITATFMMAVDPRHSTWHMPKQFEKLNEIVSVQERKNPRVSTLSQNLPFFHKAQRDFTDITTELSSFSVELEKQLGPFLGPMYHPLSTLYIAGIFYETGDLVRAEQMVGELVQSSKHYPPEIRFCAYSLHCEIMRLMGKSFNLNQIERLIVQTKSYYLSANFNAYETDTQLYSGNKAVAIQCLNQYEPDDVLRLYKIVQYFTAARAMIVLNKYSDAIKLLDRLIEFSKDFRRNADLIEAMALQSICSWHMSRHDESVKTMNAAIRKATELQITTSIAKNGNDVMPILKKIMNRLKHGYDVDTLDKAFVNRIYLQAKTISQYVRGMLSKTESTVTKLSPRQNEMLGYLTQNLSYQEISDKTGISLPTVRYHITKLYEKLNVATATDAVMKARELSL